MLSGVRSVLLSVALLLAGCGYKAAGPEATSRPGVETVAVPVVANATNRRDLTDPLTAALVRQIQARTAYEVADAGDADSLLEVTVVDADLRTLGRDRATGLPEQQQLAVTVDLRWTDLRTGRELLAIEGLEQTADFLPTLGEGEFVARQDAAERLAGGIVDELGDRW